MAISVYVYGFVYFIFYIWKFSVLILIKGGISCGDPPSLKLFEGVICLYNIYIAIYILYFTILFINVYLIEKEHKLVNLTDILIDKKIK